MKGNYVQFYDLCYSLYGAHGVYINSSIVDEGVLVRTSSLHRRGPNEERELSYMRVTFIRPM